MTYQGPERRNGGERRDEPSHQAVRLLISDVVAQMVREELRPVADELGRLARLLEGENHDGINAGVIGTLSKLSKHDEALETRVAHLERRWDRLKWTTVGAAAAGGVTGGGIIGWLIQTLNDATAAAHQSLGGLWIM